MCQLDFQERGLVNRLEREVMHLVLGVLRGKALNRQKEFFNGLALLHVIADEEDARHGFPGANAVVRGVRDRLAIMGEEDALPEPPRPG